MLIQLLIGLVVVCLVFWAAQQLMGAFGLGEPLVTIVRVILVVIVILWLLSLFGYVGGLSGPRLHTP
jgi:hypothetical protein